MKLIPTFPQACYELKPARIPDGLVVLIDTREQRPLFTEDKPDGLETLVTTLSSGDYSIQGFTDRFVIERKQMSDFYSYLGKERDKTIRKMGEFKLATFAGVPGFAGLVIEASESDILNGYMYSRVSPETARQALISFEIRYGVHVYYSESRTDIERWILDRMVKFYNVAREVKTESFNYEINPN